MSFPRGTNRKTPLEIFLSSYLPYRIPREMVGAGLRIGNFLVGSISGGEPEGGIKFWKVKLAVLPRSG